MIQFQSDGIQLFFLNIKYYALILMSGMIAAAYLTAWRAPRKGLDPNRVWDGLFWALIPGLIGARLYHVLTPSPSMGADYYIRNPLEIFAIWRGGLGIYGAIVGGALGIYIYTRRQRQPILQWLDCVAPAMALAQAIGRWGNFVNRELYGAPTDLPWAIFIPVENRVRNFTQYERFHPLFLYESIWNFAACIGLILIERRLRNWLRPGDLLLMYLMQYAVIRFLLDFLRLDSNGFGAITTAQLVSLAVFIVSGAVLIVRHRQPVRKVTAS